MKISNPLSLSFADDALLLDVDGTLLDLAAQPDQVLVSPELKITLETLRTKLNGALALISGRPIADLDQLFAPFYFSAAGIHGAQWRLLPDEAIHGFVPLSLTLQHAIQTALLPWPHLYIENKQQSIAVHYGQALNKASQIENTLRETIKEENHLTILYGKNVFEVINKKYNKGKAIESLMKTTVFNKRKPIYFGDDITDFSAFTTCTNQNWRYRYVKPGDLFESPHDVRQWLTAQANLSH